MIQATVEDLDLLPALTITPSIPLSNALELSYEREYTYLPVVSSKTKRLLGYLPASQLQSTTLKGNDDLVAAHYLKFRDTHSGRDFVKITPETPLETLQRFFEGGEEFAVVSDEDRRFVLGVVTKEDLEKFVKSRPSLKV